VSRWRLLRWPAVATSIALVVLVGLGFWQLARLSEKTAQIESLRAAATTAPIPLPGSGLRVVAIRPAGVSGSDRNQIAELSRVRVEGRFVGGRNAPVRVTLPAARGSPISGIGFFMLAPLETASGEIVFVNRGFAPAGVGWKAPSLPPPDGPQAVVGLARAPEKARPFAPADDPGKGEYSTRDPALMARALGIDPARVAPFFIDQERIGDTAAPPVGVDPREMIARIPNNHLQYAVTWFGFAATLIVIFAVFARGRLREET
jgi:surfeit locus 1 family protein